MPKKAVNSLGLDSGRPRSNDYVTCLEVEGINVIRECQVEGFGVRMSSQQRVDVRANGAPESETRA